MRVADLDLLLWAAGFAGHVLLLCVLLLRRRAGQFPLFTALIAANVLRTIVLYLIFHHGTGEQYTASYWTLALLDTGLQLAVVYELASRTFRPLGRWAPDVRFPFLQMTIASLAVALGLTWLAAPVTVTLRELLAIKGSFFSSVLMGELFVGMLAACAVAGLPLKTHVARIAWGLGAFSIIDTCIEAAHTYYGLGYTADVDSVLSHFRMAAYLVCLAYWVIALWAGAPLSEELPGDVTDSLILLSSRLGRRVQSIRSRSSA